MVKSSFAIIVLIVFLLPSQTMAQSDEAVFWQSISNSSDGAEFCAYLEAFPNGKFAALAKLRAKKLGTTCGADPAVATPAPTLAPSQVQTVKPEQAQPTTKKAVTRRRIRKTTHLREFLHAADDGVAIKWEGGYCTRLQDDGTGRSLGDSDGPSTANDFFDSKGSIGTWGVRYAGAFANFCYKFSTWSEWSCRSVEREGDVFYVHEENSTGVVDFTGVVLSPDQYKSCPDMNYADLLHKAKGGTTETSSASTESSANIDPLDQLMYVQKGANVRAQPSTNGAKLFVMNKGEQVQVTGKVRGENWYQIRLSPISSGYVFGTLLDDQSPGDAPKSAARVSTSTSTTTSTIKDEEWSQFDLKVEMFPASQWTGRDDAGCDLMLSFEHWKADSKYSWSRDCNGQTESETLVYALSPGLPWLNLPEDGSLFDLCRLNGNDEGHVKLTGCKYAGVYKNANRADQIIDAVAEYKASAPEREAEAKRRETENKRLNEEAARKATIQAKTPYGKRLKELEGRTFGQAPVPASGQGIVVCSSHRFTSDPKPSGKFPEGTVLNFNASRMELMEAELSNYGVTEFKLGKQAWMEREGYTMFDIMNGAIFYDRNIERQPHPDGDGEIVVGEMLNTPLKQYISDAPNRVSCEVMIERKTCADPNDSKGNFSMPCD